MTFTKDGTLPDNLLILLASQAEVRKDWKTAAHYWALADEALISPLKPNIKVNIKKRQQFCLECMTPGK